MKGVPIRYDPLLTARLAGEIQDRWRGVEVRRLRLHAPGRAASLEFEGGDALVCLLHPHAGHLLAVPAGSEVPLPWSGLAGPAGTPAEHRFRRLVLVGTETADDERFLSVVLGAPAGAIVCRVVLELQTNQWNALLVGAGGRIEASLWARTAGARSLRRGAPYRMPESGRRWTEATPTPGEWRTLLAATPCPERRAAALRNVAWVSAINVDWILGAAAVSPDRAEIDASLRRYLSLRSGQGGAWILELPSGRQPYPAPVHAQASPSPSLLVAMEISARAAGLLEAGEPAPVGSEGRSGTAAPADPERARLRAALGARQRRLRRRRAAMERQLDGPGPDDLRSAGQLLLARQDLAPRGSRRVVLSGFDGHPREVELEPALGPVENAERFFEQARRRERALQRLPAKIRALAALEARIRAGLADLDAVGPTQELRILAGREPPSPDRRSGGSRAPAAAALPYRRLRSSGGLEIRVGRSARANDRLTFRHASPDDIWLHARQVRGAHVILCWNRRDQNPPRTDLEEAAVVAAQFSEARHSGLVAVDWTRRKYVRKPRKAPPGSVVPDRVSTLFVEPDAARVRALQVDD